MSYGFLVCGSLLAAILVSPANQSPQEPASTVNVDGISTRYYAKDLKGRTPGRPVLVFLSGFGSALETWTPVLNELAGETPLLAYDRPGVGQSSYDGRPLTPERVSMHLHALLRALRVEPPYILVGHSWGGLLLLDFASRFPGEVVGSVYVDPTNFLMTENEHRRILTGLGISEAVQKTFAAQEEADSKVMLARMPAGLRTEFLVIEQTQNVDPSEWVPSQPSMPTSILLAGRLDPHMRKPPGAAPPALDQDAYFKAERALTLRQFRDRMAKIPGSSVQVVLEAGHAIHRDAPAIVASEIRRVLSLGRRQ